MSLLLLFQGTATTGTTADPKLTITYTLPSASEPGWAGGGVW